MIKSHDPISEELAIGFMSSNPVSNANANTERELAIIEDTFTGSNYKLFHRVGVNEDRIYDLMAELMEN